MKTLLVVSDTHGNTKGLDALSALIGENDYVVHLGDGANDMRSIRENYPEKAYACAGNCDWVSYLPTEGVLEIEQSRIFYCHGHQYGVKSSLETLAKVAKSRDCTVALYGHTHSADIREIDGVLLVNPGSLRRAVGEGGSYAYIVVHKEKITPVLVGESVF